ncbi:glycosyltransferase family 4 protein [Stakelama saccharophila]|uniref:Glycosyltransferase family 4 protein n=1 Tax=Stakelama saccharophila TaxID=3075605 RepID=A0ABZ0BD52_9SPHN|nr:glycosyltransferase family 4 protein [Stakelama sp. W311]WNO54219.1 glycosyltransferase family 4 protein [Stakelama sp. W311]
MKLLVHSSLAYSLINFRGALLRALVAAGHEVVATAPDRDPEIERELARIGVGFEPVPMARASISPLRDCMTLAAYMRLMRRHRPHAVIAYTQKPIIYGGLAARLAGRSRFHVLMSGLGYVFSDEARHRVLLRRLVSMVYRQGVHAARTIFVFNSDDRSEMLRNRIISERHYVVQVSGSGVDTTHFAARPLPDGPPVVLMIARLMRDKGVYEFVEAARRVKAAMPEVRFQILGRRDHENPTAVSEAECRNWANAGLVEILPETRDVRPHLAASSLFVLPSFHREGLPRTILEALATGRPVVTTDLPGCRDAIVEGENGRLVPPRDPEALAGAILETLADPDALLRMATAARRSAERSYDVHDVNAALLACMRLSRCESVVSPKSAPIPSPLVRTAQ